MAKQSLVLQAAVGVVDNDDSIADDDIQWSNPVTQEHGLGSTILAVLVKSGDNIVKGPAASSVIHKKQSCVLVSVIIQIPLIVLPNRSVLIFVVAPGAASSSEWPLTSRISWPSIR